jgi:hypothetical protein
MFKTVWAKGLGLVVATVVGMLIGGVALAGLGGHNALAQNGSAGQAANTIVASVSAGNADASPVSATMSAADVTAPATLTDRVIDMMKDHMGLSDQQANDWAQAMAEHMQAVHGHLSGPTLDQMYQYMDQYGYGYGMMNGINPGSPATPGTMMNGVIPGSVTPGTMMGWAATTGGATAPSTPTTQGPGTMMNGVTPGTMMGGTTTTTGTTPTTSGTTTQTTTTPQTYFTPGTMMGGTQVTPVTPAGTSGSMMNGATSGGMMGGPTGGPTRTSSTR